MAVVAEIHKRMGGRAENQKTSCILGNALVLCTLIDMRGRLVHPEKYAGVLCIPRNA